jgi:hypothetical protein
MSSLAPYGRTSGIRFGTPADPPGVAAAGVMYDAGLSRAMIVARSAPADAPLEKDADDPIGPASTSSVATLLRCATSARGVAATVDQRDDLSGAARRCRSEALADTHSAPAKVTSSEARTMRWCPCRCATEPLAW